MKNIFFPILALVLCGPVEAQRTEWVRMDATNRTGNRYLMVLPDKPPYKGYMFLVPGLQQQPEEVLEQTELPMHAAQQGILTIIPTFRTGTASFGIDTATQASFLEILDHVQRTQPVAGLPFYAGGFTVGGACAVRYAELSLGQGYAVKPSAVFAIDPPLDFERDYRALIRDVQLAGGDLDLKAEARYLLGRYSDVFGGTPSVVQANLRTLSPYSFSDTSQSAIKTLVNLPLRLYTEPDVEWWLARGVDYSGMNAFDLAAMTNELRRLGSTKVELITTTAKGYRKPSGERHPRSWSIAEPKDLVGWLLQQGQ